MVVNKKKKTSRKNIKPAEKKVAKPAEEVKPMSEKGKAKIEQLKKAMNNTRRKPSTKNADAILDDAVMRNADNMNLSSTAKAKIANMAARRRATHTNPSQKKSDIIKALKGVHGIGLAKAKELADMGVMYVHDLQRQIYFNKLSKEAQQYVQFKPLERIPRQSMSEIEYQMKVIMNKAKIPFVIAGSYRRGDEFSGDIDVITTYPIKDFIQAFMKYRDFDLSIINNLVDIEVIDPFMIGDAKASMLLKVSRLNNAFIKPYYVRMDVFQTTPEEYLWMLLFATGSGPFNIRMRAVAKNHGYLLNEKGLFSAKTKKRIDFNPENERDIFEKLGMTYKEPKDRV